MSAWCVVGVAGRPGRRCVVGRVRLVACVFGVVPRWSDLRWPGRGGRLRHTMLGPAAFRGRFGCWSRQMLQEPTHIGSPFLIAVQVRTARRNQDPDQERMRAFVLIQTPIPELRTLTVATPVGDATFPREGHPATTVPASLAARTAVATTAQPPKDGAQATHDAERLGVVSRLASLAPRPTGRGREVAESTSGSSPRSRSVGRGSRVDQRAGEPARLQRRNSGMSRSSSSSSEA